MDHANITHAIKKEVDKKVGKKQTVLTHVDGCISHFTGQLEFVGWVRPLSNRLSI